MCGVGFALFRSADDPFWRSLGLGFFALMICAAVLNFFGDRWTYQQVNGYMWVLMGCAVSGLNMMAQLRSQEQDSGSEETPVSVEAEEGALVAC
jgi:hypothetical protein